MERIFALHPILHLNDDEAREYTAAATIEAAAAILYSHTQAMIVITTGADGACVYDGSTLTCVPSVKVEHIVDTIGAGDGHCGALMARAVCSRRTQGIGTVFPSQTPLSLTESGVFACFSPYSPPWDVCPPRKSKLSPQMQKGRVIRSPPYASLSCFPLSICSWRHSRASLSPPTWSIRPALTASLP